jgi:hypothetical protein
MIVLTWPNDFRCLGTHDHYVAVTHVNLLDNKTTFFNCNVTEYIDSMVQLTYA